MNKLVVGLIGVLIALMFSVGYLLAHVTTDVLTTTVTDKERIQSGKDQKYLVFTEQETLENVDTLYFFKYNSSDVYGQIEVGKEYRFEVYGFRVPFLSMYRNIIDYDEVLE